MKFSRRFSILLMGSVLALAGCGYSTKSLLSNELKTVYVAPIKNAVDITSEITEKNPFRSFRPGLEVDLTNALINRFIFDGNLKIVPQDRAHLIVDGSVVDYRKDPLRYSAGDDIQEYRLSVTVELTAKKSQDGKVLWSERVTGDTTYFLSGSRAQTEDQASGAAVDDVARRVVDKIIEVW